MDQAVAGWLLPIWTGCHRTTEEEMERMIVYGARKIFGQSSKWCRRVQRQVLKERTFWRIARSPWILGGPWNGMCTSVSTEMTWVQITCIRMYLRHANVQLKTHLSIWSHCRLYPQCHFLPNMRKVKTDTSGGVSVEGSKVSANVANACTNCQKRRTKVK